MSHQFQFFGFEPDSEVRESANRSLDRLIDLSPYGSVAVALKEKTKDGYRCAIDLYTKQGPLIAHSNQKSANRALINVVEAICKKLMRWKELQISSKEFQKATLESVA